MFPAFSILRERQKTLAFGLLNIFLVHWTKARMATRFLCSWMGLFVFGGAGQLAWAQAEPGHAPIDLTTLKTHSRLSFRVDAGTGYDWKDIPGGFELTFRSLAPEDMGFSSIPVDGKPVFQVDYSRDPRIESLSVSSSAAGVKIRGKWKFKKGSDAPANPVMEHFEYTQANPARFFVDFWSKTGPTVAEAKRARQKRERETLRETSEAQALERKARKIASEKTKADSEDLARFCRESIGEGTDVFLPFQPVHEPLKIENWVAVNNPDRDYNYLVPTSAEKDAQYVRLALQLYKKGDLALTIRTLDFFEAEHPKSSYFHEMRFLRANAYLRLNLKPEGDRILEELVTTAAHTPVSLYASLYRVARLFNEQSYLAALEGFLWLQQKYPKHRLSWLFHLGAAECLFALRQTQRAAGEYQWVILNGPTRKTQAEAASRMGDLFLSRRQYEQAVAAYFRALTYYPKEMKMFPSVALNRGEAMYWLGQYDRSSAVFKAFLKDYPGHSDGWRATYRLGEIEGRKVIATDKIKGNAEARKWFYETVNGFPFSPGATLARLWLLQCGDHGGFDVASAEKFFAEEAARFSGDGQIFTENFKDFIGLAKIRSWVSMEEVGRSVDAAIAELNLNPATQVRRKVEELFQGIVRKHTLQLIESGRDFDALAFYKEKTSQVPEVKPKGGADLLDYLLRLSQAASRTEMGETAQSLAELYEKSLDSSNRGQHSGRQVAEVNADIDQRLAKSERAHTEALSIWTASLGKPNEAEEKKIRETLATVIEESEYSYEKEVILGLLEARRQKFMSAIQHAIRARMLLPAKYAKDELEQASIDYWIASLQRDAGNLAAAATGLKSLRIRSFAREGVKLAQGLGTPVLPSVEVILLAEADALGQLGKWGEASQVLAEAAEKGSNRLRYEYARALAKNPGAEQQARSTAVMKQISTSEQNDFWKELAKKSLGEK